MISVRQLRKSIGSLVCVVILDHCAGSRQIAMAEVYGKLLSVSDLTIVLSTWVDEDNYTSEDSDCVCLLRSAIMRIEELNRG